MTPARRLALASLVLISALMVSSPARAADTLVDFENLAPGTDVMNQYRNLGGTNRGPQFGVAPDGASTLNQPEIRQVAPGLAQSGNKIATIFDCDKEFCFSDVDGRFGFSKQFIRVFVGGNSTSGPGDLIRIRAYNSNQQQIDTDAKTVPPNSGYHTQLQVDSPSQSIVYFRLEGNGSMDDFTFDNPDVPPPADFGLARDFTGNVDPSGDVGVVKGKSTSIKFVVNRFNNSSGNISYAVSSLPSGVSADFDPNSPTAAGELTLKLTATAGAETATDREITITGTPAGPGVGPAPRELKFNLNVLGNYDVRATGIEVTQGIQSEIQPCSDPASCDENRSLPARDPANPNTPVPYQGVHLVKGRKTIARVFANVKTPTNGVVQGVTAALHGFDQNGKKLPGSPLGGPESGQKTLFSGGPGFTTGGGGQPFVTFKDRADPSAAFTFTLPPEWSNQGSIRLRAELIPPLTFIGTTEGECETATCLSNNKFELSGIGFQSTGFIEVATARLFVNGESLDGIPTVCCFEGGPSPKFNPDPRWFLSFGDATLPLRDGGFVYDPVSSYATIDVSDIASNQSDDKKRGQEARSRLDDYADDYSGCEERRFCADTILGVYGNEITSRGSSDGDMWFPNPIFAGQPQLTGDQPVGVGSYRRPDSITHEISHGFGRVHASRDCGGDSDGEVGEDWPPDERGHMQGVGIDIRAGSGGSKTPYRILAPGELGAPNGAPGGSFGGDLFRPRVPGVPNDGDQPFRFFDYMSYCRTKEDSAGIWTSVLGWEKNFSNLRNFAQAAQRLSKAAARARELAGQAQGPPVPTLRVRAIVNLAGAAEIVSVSPGDGTPENPQQPSPYRLIVKDAAGNVVSDSQMDGTHGKVEEAGGETVLTAHVRAPGAASVEIVLGGTVLATLARSPNVPSVKVTAPKKGATVGRRPGTVITWQATDADGGDLTAKIDYSMDGGRRWRPIHSGPNSGRANLPSEVLSGTRRNRGRVRVRVNDGFNEAVALSDRFTAVGRRPNVEIFSPAARQEFANDASVYLSGEAFDDTFVPILGTALRWYDGKRLIGAGDTLSDILPKPGTRRLRLVATDRLGRKSDATVRVKVLAVPPQFLTLRSPKTLKPSARRVKLKVASTIPGVLSAQGESTKVDRKTRRVTLPVRPGRGTLSLRLRLKAFKKANAVTLAIPRS